MHAPKKPTFMPVSLAPAPAPLFALQLKTAESCRDSFAHDGSWIISPVATAKYLYLATGGSFHSWKFFPILGELVCAMLDGTLDAPLQQKWHWDRDMGGGDGEVDKKPEREWRDLVDEVVDDGDGKWGGGGKRLGGSCGVESLIGSNGGNVDGDGDGKPWCGLVQGRKGSLQLVEPGAGACCV